MKVELEACDQDHCRFDPTVHKGDRSAVLILYFDDDAMGICKHHALHTFDMPVHKMLTIANIMNQLANDFIGAAMEKDEEKVVNILMNDLIEKIMENQPEIVPPINPEEAH